MTHHGQEETGSAAGALIVAIGTALAARSMLAGSPAPQAAAAAVVAPEPTGPKVLVAKRALPVGTIITADAVGYQLWPQEMVQDAYFIDGEADMQKLLGTVVRFPITAGEPVTQGSLVAPGDRGFLAAALGPGMRAVTVPVSAQSGVAGFIFPGDRVDLMLTQSVSGGQEGAAAQRDRDHPAQPARARHRPADRNHHRRERQDRGSRARAWSPSK